MPRLSGANSLLGAIRVPGVVGIPTSERAGSGSAASTMKRPSAGLPASRTRSLETGRGGVVAGLAYFDDVSGAIVGPRIRGIHANLHVASAPVIDALRGARSSDLVQAM
jgi:hypothetical protein